jgi:hypothetical protein
MGSQKKDRDLVSALLELCEQHEPTDAEVDEELRAEGIDVPAFLARVDARVKEVQEEDRLALLRSAKEKAKARQARPRSRLYDRMDHSALVAEYSKRQAANPQAATFHRNFDEMTDDDLRTLLEDQDELKAD